LDPEEPVRVILADDLINRSLKDEFLILELLYFQNFWFFLYNYRKLFTTYSIASQKIHISLQIINNRLIYFLD